MTDSTVVDLLDLDAEVLRQRLVGLSVRRLARMFGLTERKVLESLDRSLPQLSPDLKVRLYREDLERLETLISAFWGSAATGSTTAAQTVIKLLERRAHMIGADAPQKIDVVIEQVGAAPDSTSQLLAELDRIAAERNPHEGLLIEGEKTDDPPAS